MDEIKDQLGRTFKTLRISLINTCNLACTYCTYGNNESKKNYAISKTNSLPVPEMLKLIEKLHRQLGLKKIRFTGGEPLLYKDLAMLIEGVFKLGIGDLNLTTNGLLLESKVAQLKSAGLQSVNISLDATDPLTFFKMSRRHGLDQTIRGIEAARNQNMDVKINSVIMKGLNDNQVVPLLDFSFSRNLKIRFLEVMSMGHLHGKSGEYLCSQNELLNLISKHYNFRALSRVRNATANYWQTEQGHQFGIIANESQPFCSDCNRLRLDAFGSIYGCLSSNNPVSINDCIDDTAFKEKLRAALAQKQTLKFTGSKLSMLHIGG